MRTIARHWSETMTTTIWKKKNDETQFSAFPRVSSVWVLSNAKLEAGIVKLGSGGSHTRTHTHSTRGVFPQTAAQQPNMIIALLARYRRQSQIDCGQLWREVARQAGWGRLHSCSFWKAMNAPWDPFWRTSLPSLSLERRSDYLVSLDFWEE